MDMYECMYVYMYVSMYVCVYIYIYIVFNLSSLHIQNAKIFNAEDS